MAVNATTTLISALLTTSLFNNLKPFLEFNNKPVINNVLNPQQLLSLKTIGSAINVLNTTQENFKKSGKLVKTFSLEQLKDILENLGEHIDIVKDHSDDKTFEYLEYTQYALNVLESYAKKYKNR